MKKLLVIMMIGISIFLFSCEKSVTTTALITITGYINPFEGLDFIRHRSFSPKMIAEIGKSSGRIAYADDDLLVYFGQGTLQGSVFAYKDKTPAAAGPLALDGSDPLVMNYDVHNNVLYYANDSNGRQSIKSIPQVVDESIELYAGRYRDINYYNSQYLLANSTFVSFTGDTLFTTNETTPFPYQNIGDELRFYSYHSGDVSEHGCTIKTYNGFTSTPVETLVHSEYTCSRDYSIRDRKVIIPLINFNEMGGYATITADGEIHVMDFAADIPNFDHYTSFLIVNEWVLCFTYVDLSGESHDVISSYDLKYLKTDMIAPSNASRVIYLDENTVFHRYSGNEFRLYYDGVKTYTYYTDADTTRCFYDFYRCGDYGVFYELNMGTGAGKLITVNLSNGAEIVHEINGLQFDYFSEEYVLIGDEDTVSLYDVASDKFIALEISGAFRKVNDDYFMLVSDSVIYLYHVASRDWFQLNRVAYFRRNLSPYAFLVEYEGEYFLLG